MIDQIHFEKSIELRKNKIIRAILIIISIKLSIIS